MRRKTIKSSRPGPGEPFEQGRYLAMLAGCNDCHMDGYLLGEGKIPKNQWLTGSAFGWRGPWGTTYAASLGLLLPSLTEDQRVAFARQLRPRPPMPWYTVNVMHETDLRDFHRPIFRRDRSRPPLTPCFQLPPHRDDRALKGEKVLV